jgi:hypothetical protein
MQIWVASMFGYDVDAGTNSSGLYGTRPLNASEYGMPYKSGCASCCASCLRLPVSDFGSIVQVAAAGRAARACMLVAVLSCGSVHASAPRRDGG